MSVPFVSLSSRPLLLEVIILPFSVTPASRILKKITRVSEQKRAESLRRWFIPDDNSSGAVDVSYISKRKQLVIRKPHCRRGQGKKKKKKKKKNKVH
jgi:hypothetical protein